MATPSLKLINGKARTAAAGKIGQPVIPVTFVPEDRFEVASGLLNLLSMKYEVMGSSRTTCDPMRSGGAHGAVQHVYDTLEHIRAIGRGHPDWICVELVDGVERAKAIAEGRINQPESEREANVTKQEFSQWLVCELTAEELGLINPNVYLNPDHVDYYMAFKAGRYSECQKFLMDNRHLLTFEHTPAQYREYAEMNVAGMRQMQLGKQA